MQLDFVADAYTEALRDPRVEDDLTGSDVADILDPRDRWIRAEMARGGDIELDGVNERERHVAIRRLECHGACRDGQDPVDTGDPSTLNGGGDVADVRRAPRRQRDVDRTVCRPGFVGERPLDHIADHERRGDDRRPEQRAGHDQQRFGTSTADVPHRHRDESSLTDRSPEERHEENERDRSDHREPRHAIAGTTSASGAPLGSPSATISPSRT
jgi:hypothetical protein